MDKEVLKKLSKDDSGLTTYEYIANHIDALNEEDMDSLVDNILNSDKSGQFAVSTARYLFAIDSNRFSKAIDTLIKGAIDRDRERKYIGDLLTSIWGVDYASRVAELQATDDNFRRIYKRMFPAVGI